LKKYISEFGEQQRPEASTVDLDKVLAGEESVSEASSGSQCLVASIRSFSPIAIIGQALPNLVLMATALLSTTADSHLEF
jgi:hypothetical protein